LDQVVPGVPGVPGGPLVLEFLQVQSDLVDLLVLDTPWDLGSNVDVM
jgi:hypothetical protein